MTRQTGWRGWGTRPQVRRRHHLTAAVGERAQQQHRRVVDVAADGEHLVAGQARQRPVGRPFGDRVQGRGSAPRPRRGRVGQGVLVARPLREVTSLNSSSPAGRRGSSAAAPRALLRSAGARSDDALADSSSHRGRRPGVGRHVRLLQGLAQESTWSGTGRRPSRVQRRGSGGEAAIIAHAGDRSSATWWRTTRRVLAGQHLADLLLLPARRTCPSASHVARPGGPRAPSISVAARSPEKWSVRRAAGW